MFSSLSKDTSSNNILGTGFGLGIVNNLCILLGSKINYESNKPNGSKFFFTLKQEARINEYNTIKSLTFMNNKLESLSSLSLSKEDEVENKHYSVRHSSEKKIAKENIYFNVDNLDYRKSFKESSIMETVRGFKFNKIPTFFLEKYEKGVDCNILEIQTNIEKKHEIRKCHSDVFILNNKELTSGKVEFKQEMSRSLETLKVELSRETDYLIKNKKQDKKSEIDQEQLQKNYVMREEEIENSKKSQPHIDLKINPIKRDSNASLKNPKRKTEEQTSVQLKMNVHKLTHLGQSNESSILKLNIIVVDDEYIIRSAVKRIIIKFITSKKSNIELQIFEACDGLECLALLYTSISSDTKFDIIISDETMKFIHGSHTSKILENTILCDIKSDVKFFISTSYNKLYLKDKYSTIVKNIYSKPLDLNSIREIFELSGIFKKEE